MSRDSTQQPLKASGTRDGHGRILETRAGSLYVHMHREHGLAHRHYVLRSWHVRVLGLAISRPMLLLYVGALVTWMWMAQLAARVPFLQRQVSLLTQDAERLDTLTATLTELQARYDQVQRMLSAANAASANNAPAIDSGRAVTDSTPDARRFGGR